ncbi:MAG: metallophosphoesterase [Archangium sp.]|nr:metallophosphoesterase [Archangium sp.]
MRFLFSLVLFATLAHAEDFSAWEERYQFDCNGPFEHFTPADVKEREGWRFEHTGATVKVRRVKPRAGKKPVLGLLAGIKDLEPETKAMLDTFIAAFDKADVDAIVIGGDSSSEPDALDQILEYLGKATNRPLLVVAGNMERGAALNYAVLKQRKAGATHLLNLDVIRRYDGDGVDVLGLGGYHDKAYLHLAGGCIYKEKDIDALERAAAAADDTVVLLTHGPPRQKGQQAIDYVPGADNVGDPHLSELIARAKISFGIHGHILEAAGRGTDASGKSLPQKKPHPALFVNQGSANPLPWKLNDGSTSYGLAALLTIDGKKASYEILRGAKPKTP